MTDQSLRLVDSVNRVNNKFDFHYQNQAEYMMIKVPGISCEISNDHNFSGVTTPVAIFAGYGR
jgi:hypothetical protein